MTALKLGENVFSDDGETVVTPEQVLKPGKRGRKIVYIGDNRFVSKEMKKLTEKADLVIHEATNTDDMARTSYRRGHSTPLGAVKLATECNTKMLLLTHFSNRQTSEVEVS